MYELTPTTGIPICRDLETFLNRKCSQDKSSIAAHFLNRNVSISQASWAPLVGVNSTMFLIRRYSQSLLQPSVRTPKKDFIDYCNDLAKQESAMVDESCFSNAFGYSFTALFDQLILTNHHLLSQLQIAEYCMLVSSTPEYDPDYSHVGCYLKNRYAFAGDMMDVMAQAGMGCCIAFRLMLRFFELKKIKRGAVMQFEQSVIPVSKFSNATERGQNNITLYLFELI